MAESIDSHLRDWEDIKGIAGSLREDGGTDIGQLLTLACGNVLWVEKTNFNHVGV